jgi:hypothetical protein
MPEDILKLAALRRVATRAGAVRFNAAIGTVIGQETQASTSAERSATLQRLLSLYNQMRAAKLYGQEDKFKAAQSAMADAINNYSKRSPGGADKIRDIVKKLSFADEEAQRKEAISAKNKKSAAGGSPKDQ